MNEPIHAPEGTRCGLLGEHLSHSFSPEIHAFLADYPYDLYEVEADKVEEFFQTTNLSAFNVTIPYKKTVMPYLAEISDEARRIGAVNTVLRLPDGSFRGENTDYYGFLCMVRDANAEIEGKKVLVLGTGGASVTVITVLKDLGAAEIISVSRTGECNYENVYTLHADADVIVNTTPVGMYPSNGISPIRLSAFPSLSCVLDLIYNPARTALLLEAERLGIKHRNGLLMLVAQAKRACELFLGVTLPDDRIREVVKLVRKQTENIILIGMPGCGKSTAARNLSKLTGRASLDTDVEFLSFSGGVTPAEMISADGEPAFRSLESKAVEASGKHSQRIIATGGGVPTIKENYDALHQNGVIIWILKDLNTLSTAGRPLSQGKNVHELYRKRKKAYTSFADLSVRSCKNPRTTAKMILSAFEQYIDEHD